jgi:hypothetical protein
MGRKRRSKAEFDQTSSLHAENKSVFSKLKAAQQRGELVVATPDA